MDYSMISIQGYDILGTQGSDGLRYAWKYKDGKALIESAAFAQRSTTAIDDICGYTTSVSAGCILRTWNEQCTFCRTGSVLPFCGKLTFRDIAKQNIFMVLTDMHCEEHPELRNRPREFAYMGQGEPGFSYSQVRLAIELTNRAMEELGQRVHRHIFATCGVPEAIVMLKNDIQNYYTQRVTLHFSLHATENRGQLMPIDGRWSFSEVLYAMDNWRGLTGEKPCIGIMLFNDFQPNGKSFSYSNCFETVKQILSMLDHKEHRLSFCTYNPSDDICKAAEYPQQQATEILNYAQSLGFEAKLFSSFGQEKQTACGMLGGKPVDKIASMKWRDLEKEADNLIQRLI